MTDHRNLPDFDGLPTIDGVPHRAWGVFDKDGKKDYLGCINLLTPDVVKEAFKEARDGVSISLNWPLAALAKPGFDRKPFVHKPFGFKDPTLDMHVFDDEIEFNTQSSSQWDSLVHYAHQPSGLNYNGAKPSQEQLVQNFGELDYARAFPTLNHWHERGGLVGRGILLDYKEFAKAQGIEYDCFDDHAITVSDLEAVAKHQGTDFKFGDILLVRTGFTDELGEASAERQAELLSTHKAVGVAGCKETARWVWNRHFAGVASDSVGFEVVPPKIEEEGDRTGSLAELVLHQYFLSNFGLNIGELWDTKALGEHCKNIGRYEFLLTSCPLNVYGSVGSPPNALAIF